MTTYSYKSAQLHRLANLAFCNEFAVSPNAEFFAVAFDFELHTTHHDVIQHKLLQLEWKRRNRHALIVRANAANIFENEIIDP